MQILSDKRKEKSDSCRKPVGKTLYAEEKTKIPSEKKRAASGEENQKQRDQVFFHRACDRQTEEHDGSFFWHDPDRKGQE